VGRVFLVPSFDSVGSAGTFGTWGEAVGKEAVTVTDRAGAAVVAMTGAAIGDNVIGCTEVEVAGGEATVTGVSVGESVVDCTGVEASAVGAATVAIGAEVADEAGDAKTSDVGCPARAAPGAIVRATGVEVGTVRATGILLGPTTAGFSATAKGADVGCTTVTSTGASVWVGDALDCGGSWCKATGRL
jgi:hypothetical protein